MGIDNIYKALPTVQGIHQCYHFLKVNALPLKGC